MKVIRLILVATLIPAAPACVSTPSQPSPTPMTQAVSAPVSQPAPSSLSYGTVTSQVVKGRTTQADLLHLFGGPNISTVDNEGVETWIYERSVTQTDVSSKNQSWQAAANLGLFFGQVSAGAQGGAAQSASASSMATSFRSLTVWVKFGDDRRVKDYSVRASQF